MPEIVKSGSLKFHIMPENVYTHFNDNNLITENEVYLVEDSSDVIPLTEGGTGVAARTVEDLRTILGVASINHATNETTCGTGTDTRYGHLRLSDEIDLDSDVHNGVAATPTAIKKLNDNITDLKESLNSKAPLESPIFTGSPTAPTAAIGTNNTQIATTEFVNAGFIKKPIIINITLNKSDWDSSNNTYTIDNANILSESNGHISPSLSITDIQYESMLVSRIRILDQSEGILVLKCMEIPTIDIPIVLNIEN